jgi:hypothetical protein
MGRVKRLLEFLLETNLLDSFICITVMNYCCRVGRDPIGQDGLLYLYSLDFPTLCQFLNLSGLGESILHNCWWLVYFWRLEIVAVHGNEQVTQTSTRRRGEDWSFIDFISLY